MPVLTCEISQSLLDAITERSSQTGETIDHVVMDALSDALQVDHATLFQISTAGALVAGVSSGMVTVAELQRHGDFGLGTFADFDGEMVVSDGVVYQVTQDGVRVADADATVPFAVVTHFVPESTTTLVAVESFDDLVEQLDASRVSNNEFFAVRIEGRFAYVKTRAACKTDGSATLVEVAAAQATFELDDVEGVLVGFWTPEYLTSVAVTGWHLHFLTTDASAGGHLLTIRAKDLTAQTQPLTDFRMALPETPAFLAADLSRDVSSDILAAEADN